MVRFDQNRIVFEDENNIDQYRVELLNTGELEVEYLPSGDMWKFENNGSLDTDSLSVGSELGNAIYQSLADVPSNLAEGTQVYVLDENSLFVEDGT